MDPGVILSVDGAAWIHEDEIEDVALPLYQGVMIWQLDFSVAAYRGGAGLHAKWVEAGCERKVIESQYLISEDVAKKATQWATSVRLGFRGVQNATNQRTMIACLIPGFPCGNSIPTLRTGCLVTDLALLAALVSFPLDRVLRMKMSQNNVNWFYVSELPVPRSLGMASRNVAMLENVSLLTAAGEQFAPLWLWMGQTSAYRRQWALAHHERLRLRCMLDAVVAELYGLEWDDLSWILRECDYPADRVQDNAFTRTLDPKGFWRVDKNRDPELRHTVLTMAAFRELKELISSQGDRQKGIEAFYAMNGGEGWMLPETLRLADLGLGHDERSEKAQLVRAKLGERFLPWQSEITPEESWKECHLHARNILGADGYDRLVAELAGMPEGVQEDTEWPARAAEPAPSYGVDALGSQLRLFTPGQKDLSGDDAGDVRLGRNHRR